MSNGKKLLLTGASGFIGSEVARITLGKGYEILNLDLRPPRIEEHTPYWRACDVRDAAAVAAAFAEFQPDFVIHLASDTDVNLKALSDFTTTVDGTRTVLRAAETVPTLQRFVHVSTQYVVTPGVTPKSETDFKPYTIYGAAKAETEKLVRASSIQDWVIVRPTIIWGPHHPSFAEQIWRRMAEGSYRHPAVGKPLMRGYGYVTNTAEQMVGLMEADLSSQPGRVFYLGDGMLDYDLWADAFCQRFTGRPARRIPAAGLFALGVVGSSMRKLGLSAPFDMGRYFRMTTAATIDFAPTFALLDQPTTSFETGVEDSVAWLKTVNPKLFGGPARR